MISGHKGHSGILQGVTPYHSSFRRSIITEILFSGSSSFWEIFAREAIANQPGASSRTTSLASYLWPHRYEPSPNWPFSQESPADPANRTYGTLISSHSPGSNTSMRIYPSADCNSRSFWSPLGSRVKKRIVNSNTTVNSLFMAMSSTRPFLRPCKTRQWNAKLDLHLKVHTSDALPPLGIPVCRSPPSHRIKCRQQRMESGSN